MNIKQIKRMKSILHLILPALAVFSLSACAIFSGKYIDYADYIAGFTGVNEQQLQKHWGQVKEKDTLNDEVEIWKYSSSRLISVQTMPAQYHNYYDGKKYRQRLIRPAQYRSETVYCYTSFYLENGIVNMWQYEGNCVTPKNAADILVTLKDQALEEADIAAGGEAVRKTYTLTMELDDELTAKTPGQVGSVALNMLERGCEVPQATLEHLLFFGVTTEGLTIFQNIHTPSGQPLNEPYLVVMNFEDTEGFHGDNFLCGRLEDSILGPYTEKYINGQKKEEGYYLIGRVKHGRWTGWLEDGQQIYEGSYKQGKHHGQWTWWYGSGQKSAQGEIKDGLKQGRWLGWHPNGQQKYEEHYNNLIRVGVWKNWDENGDLINIKKYSEPIPVVLHKSDYVHGYWLTGYWVLKDGDANVSLHLSGQKLSEENKTTGEVVLWHENGQIMRENSKNKRMAKSQGWHLNGMKSVEWLQLDEQPISERRWDELGVKRSEINYEIRQRRDDTTYTVAHQTYWYGNGQKRAQGEYHSDSIYPKGEWSFWDEYGDLSCKGQLLAQLEIEGCMGTTINRFLCKKTPQGYYLVQEFYVDEGEEAPSVYTSPYLIKDKNFLYKGGTDNMATIPISGSYMVWLEEGTKHLEIIYDDKNPGVHHEINWYPNGVKMMEERIDHEKGFRRYWDVRGNLLQDDEWGMDDVE